MENFLALIKYNDIFSLKNIITLLTAILIALVFLLFKDIFSYIIIRIFNIKVKDKKTIKKSGAYKPLNKFFSLLGIYLACIFLNLPENIFVIINKIFRISIILLTTNGITNFLTPNSTVIIKLNKRFKLEKEKTVSAFISKFAIAFVYIIAAALIITELGYNINGIIAGLGIGSVTIALAAQDIAKNIFSGFVILTDKPFIVGDWIEAQNIEGVVENITFRSTRIRTFDDSVVTIPNSTIANTNITNWSKMNKRRIKMNIEIDFDTPLKNVCTSINNIKLMLENHEQILNKSLYVNFDQIKDKGFNILIYCFTTSVRYKDYLLTKENINFKIMQILEHDNTNIAFPTQVVKVSK